MKLKVGWVLIGIVLVTAACIELIDNSNSEEYCFNKGVQLANEERYERYIKCTERKI